VSVDSKRTATLLATYPIEAWLREQVSSAAGLALLAEMFKIENTPPMANAVREWCTAIALQISSGEFHPTADNVMVALHHFDAVEHVHYRLGEDAFACDVCGARPDADGDVDHGRGCFTQSADGGGFSYEEEMDRSLDPRRKLISPASSTATSRMTPLIVHAARTLPNASIASTHTTTGFESITIRDVELVVTVIWTPDEGFSGSDLVGGGGFRTTDEVEAIREMDKLLRVAPKASSAR